MPYANSNGIRIHYHVEGAGPTLVLQHGSGYSMRDWYDDRYVEGLRNDYQLILTDARGHGASDKPKNRKDFSLKLRASDIVAVLDELDIDKTHYLGYSMGARIGFAIAKFAPTRVHSLILGGNHAYSLAPSPRALARQSLKKAWRSPSSCQRHLLRPLPLGLRARQLAIYFRLSIAALAASNSGKSQIDEVLPSMHMPCLLYVGEKDPRFPAVRECASNMPNATFFSLPGLDHDAALRRSVMVLPCITEFLAGARQQMTVSS